MDLLREKFRLATTWVDELLEDLPRWQVASCSFAIGITALWMHQQINHKTPMSRRMKKFFFKTVRSLPFVQKRVQKELEKTRRDFEIEMQKTGEGVGDVNELPKEGWNAELVKEKAKAYINLGEFDWTKGTQSGTVYNGSKDLTNLMTNIYGLAAWTNPLHPDTFPGIRKMEAEIVRMSCNLFNGGPKSCGTMTTGGTESIILAVKAYRDYAREVMGIADPVIVVPKTAHAAFDKAAMLLDITIRHVSVDPDTQRVDLRAMKRCICRRTCLLVGSAPQFPHGSIDDIEGIAELGLKYGIPVHVDACLGGFLICFMREAGYSLKPFDFSVKGVTSISADTHKYGYAPKGSSVILYSEEKYRSYQWFSVVDWPGGLYATSTIGGSRAGGIIAACWASMVHHGKSGYIECTKKIIETTKYITKGLRKIKSIKIIGVPEVSVVSIGSDEFSIYSLCDLMKKRGWNLNGLQFPSSIHLCCTLLHTNPGVADKFLKDIEECSKLIMANPEEYKGGTATVYGSAQAIPDRDIVGAMAGIYLDAYYSTKQT